MKARVQVVEVARVVDERDRVVAERVRLEATRNGNNLQWSEKLPKLDMAVEITNPEAFGAVRHGQEFWLELTTV